MRKRVRQTLDADEKRQTLEALAMPGWPRQWKCAISPSEVPIGRARERQLIAEAEREAEKK